MGRIGKEKATFYLDADLLQRLRVAATDSGIPQGKVIETALRSMLDKRRGRTTGLTKGPRAAQIVAAKLREEGRTLEQIASKLNHRGYRTKQGREWSLVSVSRLLS